VRSQFACSFHRRLYQAPLPKTTRSESDGGGTGTKSGPVSDWSQAGPSQGLPGGFALLPTASYGNTSSMESSSGLSARGDVSWGP